MAFSNHPSLSKYRLLARLGSGGMAEVYLAVAGGPGGFSKLQVLKVLKPDLSDQERTDFVQMFQDEGRLAARLNHPNIVQSHEVGSQDGYDFIAMEYLEGQPLSRVQERTWPSERQFPLEMQLYVLSQVLEGLEYAHALTDYDGTPLNIVHRDISPQNVFITYAGHTKLVDFGIAKTLESCKTRAGVVKGKVPYMSPEQVVAGNIDRRADLFSVGVMLWEAIARRPMHGTSTVYEILRRLVQGDLPSLREAAPDVSPELERIVLRALAHKPEDRYPDAAAFREDLWAVMDGFRKIGPREIGERVSSLFVDERREINEVIRRSMTEVRERGAQPGELASVHLLPTLRVLAATGNHRPAAPTTETRTAPTTAPAIAPAMAAAVAPTSTAPPVNVAHGNGEGQQAPRRRRAIALLGLAGAGIAVALAVALSRPDQRARSEVPVTAVEAAKTAAAGTVRVSIRAFPEDAQLRLDGKPLGSNPYDAEHTRDEGAHTLSVNAPGFHERTITIRLNRDVDMEVRLAEVAGSKNAKSAPIVEPERDAAPQRPRSQTGGRWSPAAAAAAKKDGASSDPYGEFPKIKTPPPSAPPLDTSDPW